MGINKITLENFSQHNRDRKIGNSLYRICRGKDDSGKWYIHETYAEQMRQKYYGEYAGRN